MNQMPEGGGIVLRNASVAVAASNHADSAGRPSRHGHTVCRRSQYPSAQASARRAVA